MLSNYICAIDIGSSKIAAVVAQIKRKRIVNIFFESLPVKGIKRGAIVDSVDLTDTVARLLKHLKVKSGINIKSIYTNISGLDIVTKHSYAIIPLAERGNKVITLSDIHKVNEQARILASNLEEEIIHQIPFGYHIDSRRNILNPFGLYSHRLEVDLYLVCTRLSTIESLTRVINQAGCEIKDLFFSGLVTSRIVFNQEPKEGIDILCDIGAAITELLIFKDGRLYDLEILSLGGDDLTAEVSDNLKTSFDLAEDIKRSYGIIGDSSRLSQDNEILVKRGNVYKPIRQRLVCEILTLKAKSICQAIKEIVDKNVDCSQVNNFVTCGKTILVEGFLELMESTLEVSVKLGRITKDNIAFWVSKDNNLSGQKYLTYLTSLGILYEVLQGASPLAENLPDHSTSKNFILKAIHRFKEAYQEYF